MAEKDKIPRRIAIIIQIIAGAGSFIAALAAFSSQRELYLVFALILVGVSTIMAFIAIIIRNSDKNLLRQGRGKSRA